MFVEIEPLIVKAKSIAGTTPFAASLIIREMEKAKVVDVAEVVRCKDCKCHYYETALLRDEIQHFCSRLNKQVFSDFYCAYGERK